MLVTFTGGEPTLRKDLESIVVVACAAAAPLTYLQMITHGGMLSLERALSLWDAGIDQFNISLDYLDERHDAARGIPGLSVEDPRRSCRACARQASAACGSTPSSSTTISTSSCRSCSGRRRWAAA